MEKDKSFSRHAIQDHGDELSDMSATAQQRMKIANAKAEKNITARGNVPKSTKPDQDKYPVSCDDIVVDVNENYFRLVLGCLLSSSS